MHSQLDSHQKRVSIFFLLYATSLFSSTHNDPLGVLAGFNNAIHGVHVIAEEVELWQGAARNSLAHSRMCRGDGVKEPPQFLLQGAIESLAEENRRYPSETGFAKTRKIVLNFIEKKFGIAGLSIDNLCPNNGVSDAFAKTVALLLRKKDVVISFAPTFGLHSRTVNSFGGEVIPIDVIDKERFLPTIQELEEHIIKINGSFENKSKIVAEMIGNEFVLPHAPRVKLLNLINPSNPLGSVINDTPQNREYYRQIYKLAEKYNFMIFDDLVYWGTEHDPAQRAMPFLTAVPQAKERVIMAFGQSKAIGGARMRTGMLVGPSWFVKQIRTVILNINSGISAFNQYVMAAAFDIDNDAEREVFLRKNAKEYALRRDVCIVGLVGEKEALHNPRYTISQSRMDEIKLFVRLVAYARLLIQEYNQGAVSEIIQKAFQYYEMVRMQTVELLKEEEWFKNLDHQDQESIIRNKIQGILANQNFPEELHVISYVFYRELKNKSNIVIPKDILPFLDSVHLSEKLRWIEIPQKYKKHVEDYTHTFLKGTEYLKIYSIPQATFFLTIDASALIGKYSPVDIETLADARILKDTQGIALPQGKEIIKTPLQVINPTQIHSSREIDLLCSWIGGHNYISGELMNVCPQRGLLRMTYAEPPVIFLDALDSLRYVEQFIKPSASINMWANVF